MTTLHFPTSACPQAGEAAGRGRWPQGQLHLRHHSPRSGSLQTELLAANIRVLHPPLCSLDHTKALIRSTRPFCLTGGDRRHAEERCTSRSRPDIELGQRQESLGLSALPPPHFIIAPLSVQGNCTLFDHLQCHILLGFSLLKRM